MCYFTSQHLRAEDVARKYGRRMDAVNAARVVLTQKEEEARQKLSLIHIWTYAPGTSVLCRCVESAE